jgi:hypothetical protein
MVRDGVSGIEQRTLWRALILLNEQLFECSSERARRGAFERMLIDGALNGKWQN